MMGGRLTFSMLLCPPKWPGLGLVKAGHVEIPQNLTGRGSSDGQSDKWAVSDNAMPDGQCQ